MSDDKSTKKTNAEMSRRDLAPFAMGAIAIGAGALKATQAMAASPTEIPSIRIPKDQTTSLAEAPKIGSFEGKGMTGAEVFAKLCKEENLAAMFMCPGNYTVTHAIAATGIPSYGGRTEGSMCAAADGFARATGEVVACSGTEGPGITNMVMQIAAAHAARSPMLVLASNMDIASEDSERYIQIMYQQPITDGIKKYGKRLITPNRVHEYGGYAFRALKSGIPGPVHLDFPGEVARARFTDASQLTNYYDKSKYRTESRATPARKDIMAAVDMINKAERPVLVAGHGIFHRKAWDALRMAVEKHEIAVVATGPMRGHFPDDHRLSISQSPGALMSADLVIFVGQYCMPNVGEYRFNPDIKAIRVHPVQEDLGRNWPLDIGIVGDELSFLEMLANELPRKKRDKWISEVTAARTTYHNDQLDIVKLGMKYGADTNTVHPSVIGKVVHDVLYKGKIDPLQTVTTWGGYTPQRFINPMLRANRPAQEIVCPYQFGAIGPDLAMSVGTAAAVKEGVGPQSAYKGAPTVCITTDSGMSYSLFEMETAVKYKIPVIGIVYNNNSWGTWANTGGSPRAMHLHLYQENLRYDKMAEGLGCRGEYVRTAEELRAALERAYDIAARESLPSLINVQALKEFTSGALYPPGTAFPPEPSIGSWQH
jgi:thiamine pyrophosphate-dependent acetolactate synthase large subunit-like protein